MSCACGQQHKTPQACAGARHFSARPEIWHTPKRRRPRVLFAKPCGRGGCTADVIAYGPKRLARKTYCSPRCAYLERVRRQGRTWCHAITTEERRRGARKAGRIVGERQHRRALVAAADRAMRILPADIVEILTPVQLLRLRVGIGKVWLDGRKAGFTAKAHQRRKERAA